MASNTYKYKIANIKSLSLNYAIPPPDTIFAFMSCEDFQVAGSKGKHLIMVKEHNGPHTIFWLESKEVVVSFKLYSVADIFLLQDKILVKRADTLHAISFSVNELWRISYETNYEHRKCSLSPNHDVLMEWNGGNGDFHTISTNDGSIIQQSRDSNLTNCFLLTWVSNDLYRRAHFHEPERYDITYAGTQDPKALFVLKYEAIKAPDSDYPDRVKMWKCMYARDYDSGHLQRLHIGVETARFMPGSGTHGIILFHNGKILVEMLRDIRPREKRLLLMFARMHDKESHIYDLPLDLFVIILKYARLIK